MSARERHLYAALVSDLTNLYPALNTWEDHLWAEIQHRMEHRIEKRWNELGGFWQQEEQAETEGESINGQNIEDVFASISKVQKDEIQYVQFIAFADEQIGPRRSLHCCPADDHPGSSGLAVDAVRGPAPGLGGGYSARVRETRDQRIIADLIDCSDRSCASSLIWPLSCAHWAKTSRTPLQMLSFRLTWQYWNARGMTSWWPCMQLVYGKEAVRRATLGS